MPLKKKSLSYKDVDTALAEHGISSRDFDKLVDAGHIVKDSGGFWGEPKFRINDIDKFPGGDN